MSSSELTLHCSFVWSIDPHGYNSDIRKIDFDALRVFTADSSKISTKYNYHEKNNETSLRFSYFVTKIGDVKCLKSTVRSTNVKFYTKLRESFR